MTTYTTLAPSPVASSPVPAVSPQAADVPSSPAVASSPGATPAIDHTPSPLSTTVYTTTVIPTQDTPPPSPVSPMPPPSSPTSDSPSPPIATPPVSSNKQGSPPSRPEVMAYYPDWVTADFPPEKIDFNRLDWIDYAFAVPDASYNVQWDGADDGGQFLTRLVNAAHAAGKKVKVSIGGWTGSRYFSPATSSDTTRKQLATNILNLYRQYNLDGVDIDWEYPAQQGDSANAVSPSDTANYLLFLQLLRKTLPPQAKITAAAMTVPWAGPDGQPLKDMREFAQVLDWVLLMNYDTWGSSLKPGPNSPLNDACHNSTQPSASAVSSIQMWTQAGFPARQIVLGVPSYGYISKSSATRLRTRRDVGVLQDPRALSGSGRRLRRDAAAAASSGLGLGLGWGVLNPLVAGALVDALVPDLVAAEEKEKEKQPQPPGRPASSGSGSDTDSGDGSADSSPKPKLE
ncbi:hypothetical protein EUX98_g1250 [Antrodiella citrinella]|uniref:GH18 domain-containing protein n=1 Tax=Antrodiella citrinella TaxID=2447956 RepID=A0A4S4N1Z7_9APHY|nr:hypothetical protein EUX98_g1250 [Antrodiella citrinella]